MICFDDYRLDVQPLCLYRCEVKLEATPQTIEVLAHLIENRQRTVSRQELIERFWPRAGSGADAALNTCVRRIRILLEDAVEEPKYVQTRPRTGYRFVGTLLIETPVVSVAAVAPDQVRQQSRARAILAAVAVLACGAAVITVPVILMRSAPLSVVIEPVAELCDAVMFPMFKAGLRESLQVQLASQLPQGHDLVEPGRKAELYVRSTLRQTRENTSVTLTLVRARDGVILLSEEFIAPTEVDDYVPSQQALARRMAIAVNRALLAVRP